MSRGVRRALLALVVIVLVAVVGYYDRDTLRMDQSRYCQMVFLHKMDSSIGWPDYAHSYATECLPDGSVREKDL